MPERSVSDKVRALERLWLLLLLCPLFGQPCLGWKNNGIFIVLDFHTLVLSRKRNKKIAEPILISSTFIKPKKQQMKAQKKKSSIFIVNVKSGQRVIPKANLIIRRHKCDQANPLPDNQLRYTARLTAKYTLYQVGNYLHLDKKD